MNLLEMLKMAIGILTVLAIIRFTFFLISKTGYNLFVKFIEIFTRLLK